MPHKDLQARKEYLRQWRERNLEEIKAKQKAYCAENKERRAAVNKARYEAKREELLAQMREHRANNRERINQQAREYRAANKERLAAEARRRYHATKAAKAKNSLVAGAKRRAQEKGLDFDLTVDGLTWPDTCPVLGITLTYNGAESTRDTRASLDRIDCTKGYTMDNVRVISQRANRIKSDATAEELRKIAAYIEAPT